LRCPHLRAAGGHDEGACREGEVGVGRAEANLECVGGGWSEVQYKPLTKLNPKLAKAEPGYSLYLHLSNCSYEIDKRGFFIQSAREKLW